MAKFVVESNIRYNYNIRRIDTPGGWHEILRLRNVPV